MNLPPKDENQELEDDRAKRMKIQRNTKGKDIPKYELSDEAIAEQDTSEEESTTAELSKYLPSH